MKEGRVPKCVVCTGPHYALTCPHPLDVAKEKTGHNPRGSHCLYCGEEGHKLIDCTIANELNAQGKNWLEVARAEGMKDRKALLAKFHAEERKKVGVKDVNTHCL